MRRFIAIYLPLKDLKQLRYIAVYCLNITPLVGVETDITKAELESTLLKRGLVLDISGTKLLYPSEDELLKKISMWLDENNFIHGIAAASSIGSAWALSRFKKPLPLAALRINKNEIQSMKEVGIESLNELLNLSLKNIGHRFGLNVFKRVNQYLGTIEEPLRYIKLSQVFSIQRKFEIPISSKETVSKWVNFLLQDLLNKTCDRAKKASTFMLVFQMENGKEITRNISLYLASDNHSHIASVIETNIEHLKFTSSIKTLKIAALDFRLEAPLQSSILETEFKLQDKERSIGEYLNFVSNKLGSQNIKKVIFNSSYIPEKSFGHIPAQSASDKNSFEYISDRPSKLFDKPIPFQAISMLPDSAPGRITLKGKNLKIIKGEGPERINLEWWNSSLGESVNYRDYFKLLDEKGRCLWVYRQADDMNWFLHGIWI